MTVANLQWTFNRAHKGRFHIGPEARTTMLGFLQHGPRMFEAGGVLIGRHLIGSEDIIVDQVTTPLRGDKRSRFSFYRAHKCHQHAVDRAWKASGGVYTYLGEWHTHAEPVPTPSGLDERERIRILETARCSHPIFFVVLGTESARIWEVASLDDIQEVHPAGKMDDIPRAVIASSGEAHT